MKTKGKIIDKYVDYFFNSKRKRKDRKILKDKFNAFLKEMHLLKISDNDIYTSLTAMLFHDMRKKCLTDDEIDDVLSAASFIKIEEEVDLSTMIENKLKYDDFRIKGENDD